MNIKRMRGRNHRGSGGGTNGGGGGGGPSIRHGGGIPMNRNHVFDSSGPDLRVRGTAQQLFEKYLQLGRDATSSGDRVMAESYFQHAEHYFRILNAMTQAAQQNGQGGPQNGQGNGPQTHTQNQQRRSGSDLESELEEAEQAEQNAAGMGDQPGPTDSRDMPNAVAPVEA